MSEYDFTEIANIIAARENIQDHKVELQYSTNKGDGYTGSVRALTIVGLNKQLNVVVKYSHRDPKAHDNIPLHQAYTKEIYFYEVIVPTYNAFQSEYNIPEPFNNYAGYYGSITTPLNECVAMENIKYLNYELWDKTKEMNKPHLEMALKAFARFHGTSMAMKYVNPKLHQKIISGMDEKDLMLDVIESIGMIKQVKETLEGFDEFDLINEKTYIEKLNYFCENMDDILRPVLSHHDKYDVILQGDCWCNNAMYYYEDLNDRSKPNEIKLLDWQFLKQGSVVSDLAYFFYSIAPKESLDNLNYFLKFYHDTLATHLKGFGLKIDDIYPFKVFLEHWEKISLYGFIMSLIVRKIVLIESQDAPDIRDTSGFFSNLNVDNVKESLHKQQVKNLIMHFVDRKFL